MTKHLTGVPPVSSTYCMTHDNHTRCRRLRALENRRAARDPELGIWTRECVLASALYTMAAGVALLVQGLRSSKRAISRPKLEWSLVPCEARAQTKISKVGDRRSAWARGRGRRVQAVDLASLGLRSHGHQRGAIPAFLDKAFSALLSASKAHRRKLLGPKK